MKKLHNSVKYRRERHSLSLPDGVPYVSVTCRVRVLSHHIRQGTLVG